MKRPVLVFRQFGNKGYSLFACLGREVVCSVLSVTTLTYASAESVSTDPVVTDSAAMTTAREMVLEEVSVTGSRAPLTKSQAARMVTVLDRADIAQAPVQSINDLLKYAIGVDVRQRGPIGAQTDPERHRAHRGNRRTCGENLWYIVAGRGGEYCNRSQESGVGSQESGVRSQ